ncbi:MAG: hypothetical protein IJN44_10780 [Clostridia bacterium]|nr:hypothetical protein [Clostridia bacterium]
MNQDEMRQELTALATRAFSLPEVKCIQVRDAVMERGELLPEKIKEAVEKSWHDCMSDVDLCVCVCLHPEADVSEAEYMARVDRFGLSRSACLGRSLVKENRMWRIVLKNGMRYDFGFSFEWSEEGKMLSLPPVEAEKENDRWPMENADRFWFVQVQALGKLYRRDYLIADHLAHMGLNETLVQQMVLRDMKHGTNHHRYGYEEERAYEKQLHACPLCTGDESRDRIAKKLYAAAVTYDEMMLQFYPDWEEKTPDFLSVWQSYEQHRKAMLPKQQEENMENMYCEHCQKMIEGDVCPECERKGRTPEEMDPVFLAEKGHPWSDMLCDVLRQEGVPSLRRGTLGAGMMMTIGQYLDLESVYVPYHHLEKAKEIYDGLFGEVTDVEETEEL